MNSDNNFPGQSNTDEPLKVLQAFFNAHSVDAVKLALLTALQGYALNEKKGFLEPGFSEEDITEMFDSLIALVAAVEKLTIQGRIEGIPG
ncbi:hypothetical protein ABIB62_004652 [Mucilaginibacter sp. UYP25]|uniref:hypothetical protein n=1 Tax=unclassified Mucilaginibacter TaxID=2617802 RepID=UPI0033909C41